ncbi:MAG: hypothetical protein AAFW68_02710, partial [Pseudomonadota bacterium]
METPNGLPAIVLYAIGAIYALLIVASIIVAVMRRAAPGEATTELSRRVMSWWFMITIFTIAIVTSPIISTVFLGFMT